jgi:hypothetical protein
MTSSCDRKVRFWEAWVGGGADLGALRSDCSTAQRGQYHAEYGTRLPPPARAARHSACKVHWRLLGHLDLDVQPLKFRRLERREADFDDQQPRFYVSLCCRLAITFNDVGLLCGDSAECALFE